MHLLPLHSIAIGTTNSPSGAEFLHSVIGNMHPAPTRKVNNERIDVEEYIPDDVPYTAPGNELKVLSKKPFILNVCEWI